MGRVDGKVALVAGAGGGIGGAGAEGLAREGAAVVCADILTGYADANDYYAKASSRPFIGRIRIPTLIIHAKDDPFIPFDPMRDPSIAANPYVLLLATEQGGHVAFVSASTGEERFWAESRVIDFCKLIAASANGLR